MGLTFTPVPTQYATAAFEFDEDFVNDFLGAWDFISSNPGYHLKHDFNNAQEREAWLVKAKAFGKTKPKGEEVVVRRIKRTGSSDPNTGHLTFTMEAKSVSDARHRRLREQAEERKRRKENGEPLRQGMRTDLYPV